MHYSDLLSIDESLSHLFSVFGRIAVRSYQKILKQ